MSEELFLFAWIFGPWVVWLIMYRVFLSIIKSWARYVPNPGPITAILGDANMDFISFEIVLPEEPPKPNDIVSGELSVAVDGGTPQVYETDAGQEKVEGLAAPQGSEVSLSFVYVDDAGNRSDTPSMLTLVLEDDVPPPSPGELGIVTTGETHEPDAGPQA